MATATKGSPPTDDDDLTGDKLVKAAAKGDDLTTEQQASATDWLLSDSPEDAPIQHKTLKINVGSDDEPRWIQWTIRSITPDELRAVQAATNRAARARRGETDELDYHAKVLGVATVDPDVREIAKGSGAPSVSGFLRDRFNHKPGLIPQMTAEVMAMSGFDDSHVQEVEAGKS
jgi:hypothetical protein